MLVSFAAISIIFQCAGMLLLDFRVLDAILGQNYATILRYNITRRKLLNIIWNIVNSLGIVKIAGTDGLTAAVAFMGGGLAYIVISALFSHKRWIREYSNWVKGGKEEYNIKKKIRKIIQKKYNQRGSIILEKELEVLVNKKYNQEHGNKTANNIRIAENESKELYNDILNGSIDDELYD